MSDAYKKRDWKAWIKAVKEELRPRKFGSYSVADIEHDDKIDNLAEWLSNLYTDPKLGEQKSSQDGEKPKEGEEQHAEESHEVEPVDEELGEHLLQLR